MPEERRNNDVPMPSARLRLAVSKAFDTLGQQSKDALFDHLKDQGVDLAGKSQYTMNQLAKALEPLFAKGATGLIIEMVWYHLEEKA